MFLTARFCYNETVEIFVSGCAKDVHSEAFDLCSPQQSSIRTSKLHNELQDCSVLRSPVRTVTIPIGTVSFITRMKTDAKLKHLWHGYMWNKIIWKLFQPLWKYIWDNLMSVCGNLAEIISELFQRFVAAHDYFSACSVDSKIILK